jgi:plastocyanin
MSRTALLVGIALVVSGIGVHWHARGGSAAIVEVDATSNPNLFDPQDITINVGDTVRWTASGNAPHDVTSDTVESDDGEFPSSGVFQGNAPPNEVEIQFNTPGTFVYYCTFHAVEGQYPGGMSGSVTVLAAATATATNTSSAPTATRTPGPSSTPSRTPTGTVTIVPSATPIATSTPVLATPFVETVAGQPTGGAAADIVAPNTGAGQTTDAPGASAIMLIASGLTLVAAAAALRGARLARK